MYVFIYLSVDPSVSIVSISIPIPILCPHFYLFFHLICSCSSIAISKCLSMETSIYPSIHPSIDRSIHLSICQSTGTGLWISGLLACVAASYLSVRRSACLSVYLGRRRGCESFRKLGVPFFWILIIKILLSQVLY